MISPDGSYKWLFGEPRLIEDLLRAYVPGPWDEADFTSLERVNASYVDERERQRHDDMVWRLRVGQRWVWVYLLLEFQQTPEPHMALRMLGYVALLAQHLVREGQCNDDGSIPLLLPVVLYTGDADWRASTQVADLFDDSLPTLIPFVPQLRYLLLQQAALVRHQVPTSANLAQALFELEQGHSPEQVSRILQALQQWLADDASAPIRRHITVWLKHWLRRSRRRGSMAQELDDVADWLEPKMKLHEKLDHWYDQALEQGQHQGLAKAVALQARLRFGPLPGWVDERLRGASDAQLERWLEDMLTASSLEQLFAR
jgi:hypothetical protein